MTGGDHPRTAGLEDLGDRDRQSEEIDRDPVDVLCVYQVIPWYIRVWLHTLELSMDGKVHLSKICEARSHSSEHHS
jgi:hypothetical protein